MEEELKKLRIEVEALKREIQIGYVLIDGKNVRSDNVIWTKKGKPLVKTFWNRCRKYYEDTAFRT